MYSLGPLSQRVVTEWWSDMYDEVSWARIAYGRSWTMNIIWGMLKIAEKSFSDAGTTVWRASYSSRENK